MLRDVLGDCAGGDTAAPAGTARAGTAVKETVLSGPVGLPDISRERSLRQLLPATRHALMTRSRNASRRIWRLALCQLVGLTREVISVSLPGILVRLWFLRNAKAACEIEVWWCVCFFSNVLLNHSLTMINSAPEQLHHRLCVDWCPPDIASLVR